MSSKLEDAVVDSYLAKYAAKSDPTKAAVTDMMNTEALLNKAQYVQDVMSSIELLAEKIEDHKTTRFIGEGDKAVAIHGDGKVLDAYYNLLELITPKQKRR